MALTGPHSMADWVYLHCRRKGLQLQPGPGAPLRGLPVKQGAWSCCCWARPAHCSSLPGHSEAFGLWRVCFPPVLNRPARRLLVEVLSEGESWLPVCSTRARATKQLGDFAHAPRVCFPGPWQRTAQGHFDVTCKPGRARERETLLGKHCP